MNRVEALDIAIDILEGYFTGNGSTDDEVPDFREAYEVLIKMKNNIQKQNLKNKMKRGIELI